MSRPLFALVVGLVALACSACDGDGAIAAALPDLTPMNGTHLFVTVPAGPLSIVSGSTIDVEVTVARDGTDAFDGAVGVAIAPEDGFSAATIDIARVATGGTLRLTVDAERKHGDVPLRVVATSADGTATGDARFMVTVRGASGALDTGFGDGGRFALGEPSAEATGLTFQSDAKVLIGGRIGSDAAVVRLMPDGRLDATFGAGGKARVTIPGLVSTNDVVLMSDGTIVLGGSGPTSAFLVRFTKTGVAEVVAEQSQSRSTALALADGELYLAGQSSTAIPSAADAQHVARLLPTGALDLNWGDNGQAFLPTAATGTCALGTGNCIVSAIAPQPLGRVATCASRGDGVEFRGLFAGGIEDKNDVLVTTADVLSRCGGIISLAPDDLYAAGTVGANGFQMLHFRRSPTGGPLVRDVNLRPPVIPAQWGVGGATRFAIAGGGLVIASADATPNGAPSRFALVRVMVFDLETDPSFGESGMVTTAFGNTAAQSRALVVYPDHRAVVAGTNGDMIAARYWP